MKAATATAVRPRFWRMFPAAILPESTAQAVQPPFQCRPQMNQGQPREQAGPDEQAERTGEAHVHVSRKRQGCQTHSEDADAGQGGFTRIFFNAAAGGSSPEGLHRIDAGRVRPRGKIPPEARRHIPGER